MLGKMMIHGLVAAILIGGAAAVYAQARDGGSPSASPAGTGYLQPTDRGLREHGEGGKHADRGDRHREVHDRDDHDRDDHDRDGGRTRHRDNRHGD